MTAFTIVLPHKRNPGNDRALAVCLSCLFENTVNDFLLITDAATDAPLYHRVNSMVQLAPLPNDICVYMASDMFLAPGWDVPMLEAILKDWGQVIPPFVTNIVVEPGVISMSGQNLQADFGSKPETFRRGTFELWCETAPMLEGKGWVCPYMFSRQRFLELGGLSEYTHTDHRGFNDSDTELFRRHEEAGGRIQRVQSYVYHLQGFSDPEEQNAAKRE